MVPFIYTIWVFFLNCFFIEIMLYKYLNRQFKYSWSIACEIYILDAARINIKTKTLDFTSVFPLYLNCSSEFETSFYIHSVSKL